MSYSQQQRIAFRRAVPGALLIALAAASFSPMQTAAQASADAPAARVVAAADTAPGADVPQPARWVRKKLFFIYEGLQSTYECQGLTDQVKSVLLQLGARRSDLDVHEAGCTSGFNQPTHFPAVAGSFSVLEPVAPEQAYSPNAAAGAVPARWQPVQVKLDLPGRDANGQCELLEQVKSRILPLFPTRNIQFQSVCSPRQLLVGVTSLRAEVLMPERGSHVAHE
jgi:hypothetical protein